MARKNELGGHLTPDQVKAHILQCLADAKEISRLQTALSAAEARIAQLEQEKYEKSKTSSSV